MLSINRLNPSVSEIWKPPEIIRVVVADAHPMVLTGIRSELARYPEIEVVGKTSDSDEALALIDRLNPDVLVLSTNMRGITALGIILELRRLGRNVEVLMLTTSFRLEDLISMLRAGAKGYLLKNEEPFAFAQAIRTVATGKIYLSAGVVDNFSDLFAMIQEEINDVRCELTTREMEVLRLVAMGYSNPTIAGKLCITIGTAKNHVSRINDKLEVNSRAEAVAWAWRHGIMTLSLSGNVEFRTDEQGGP